MTAKSSTPTHKFLSNGGMMGNLISRYDWTSTALGPIEGWSTPLKTTIGMILRSAVPMVTLWLDDGVMIYNDAYSVFAGGRHPLLLGSKVREGWPEVAAFNDHVMRTCFHGGHTLAYQDQELTLHRSGLPEQVWMNLDYSPVLDEAGAPEGVIAIVVETTLKVRAERSLKANAAQLERLNATLAEQVSARTAERDRMWRLSNEIMLVSDFDANILSVNPAFSALLGWSNEDVLGSSFMDLVHPDDRDITMNQLAALGAGTTTFRFENRYRRKDSGYSVLSWSAVPEDLYIHAVARDVTNERSTAEAMKQTEKALQQAQKMDAIGKLTGGIAHDFNNLLQVISGNLQMLSMVPLAHPRAIHWVNNAIAGVERGAKLASSLLAFGRRQALEPKVVKIGRVVAGMEDMLRHALGEATDIETVVSGGLWNTLVDVTQVETAVLNLAINARDAMSEPGKLTIEVGNAYLDDMYCRSHSDVQPGQYVSLAVSDTGCGMSPEVLAHAFDPFFSTKPEGKGTGLGLSMVYGFVKQSGGHIKIYSEIDQGTTVKLYLPRSMDVEEVQEPVNVAESVGGNETILVVEDDESVRTIVVEMLTQLGYRVLKAGDASSALSILESGISVDLLFTDVVMPGPLRSPELARKARSLLPNVAVLFTSGYTENSIVHGGRLDPGVELLGKPYSRDALAKKIRHVLSITRIKVGNPLAVKVIEAKIVSQPERPTGFSPARILLVEDEDEIRQVTFDMLRLLGHEVALAEDGSAALKRLADQTYDILITDLGLPDMLGTQVAEKARIAWPTIRVIVASGQAKIEGQVADAVLLKPYDLLGLEAAIVSVR